MFLPTLWLATLYGFGGWAGVAGLVWVAGRIWYALAYVRDPAKREAGFAIGMLAWLALLLMAMYGVGRAMWLAV
jgi:hypothetical protein